MTCWRAAFAAAAGFTLVPALPPTPAFADEATLRSAAALSGRYFGAALDPNNFDEKSYAKLATRQLGAATPENSMKWGIVEPVRGEFNWSGADQLVAFAEGNGQKIRGHTLVWHSQLPPWLTGETFTAAELRELMTAHIALEMGRYKGKIYAWDVVNEAFNDDGSWRKSIWFDAMGPDYVGIALKAARAADSSAKLYINDYNVETAGPKMQALLDLVATLKREGAPLDGVGLQSHFIAGQTPADLREIMAKFTALGVDVAVTELDVRIKLPVDAKSLARQAADYASVAAACRSVERCVGITTWGITDDHSWIPSFFSGCGAALPFDEKYQPKPAFFAAVEALTRAGH
jgi:endo-1,4-beta-xylanase